MEKVASVSSVVKLSCLFDEIRGGEGGGWGIKTSLGLISEFQSELVPVLSRETRQDGRSLDSELLPQPDHESEHHFGVSLSEPQQHQNL